MSVFESGYIEICNRINPKPRLQNKRVRTITARQRITAFLTTEIIISRPARNLILTLSTQNEVVPRITGQPD